MIIPLPHPIHYILPWMPTFGVEELPLHPFLAFKSGVFNQVPLLAGANREDSRPFIYAALQDIPLNIEEFELAVMGLFGSHGFEVLKLYDKYTNRTGDNRDALVQVGTDLLFTCGVRFIVQMFEKYVALSTLAYTRVARFSALFSLFIRSMTLNFQERDLRSHQIRKGFT